MPTPSIQTLVTDAQQVLNLDSISAVRSVVAVALANANTGTPLNPNLTTQQLWNEFYQVVNKPKSDIESIIANQLMKLLYAPPAPGGVGANGQVIFNDGGVLAGDPQFLWNKTTNLLTVTGSATITGDLTVRTTGLTVNSSGVGIGTSSQSSFQGNSPKKLVIGDGTQTPALTLYGGSGTFGAIYFADGIVGNETYRGFIEYDHATDSFNFGKAGGSAMILNASGNLAFPTGKGIDFSATSSGSGTMTSELLNDYEEGTWTPTSTSGVNLTSIVHLSAKYTKVGRVVTLSGYFSATVTTGSTLTYATLSGLPFAVTLTQVGSIFEDVTTKTGFSQAYLSDLNCFFAASTALAAGPRQFTYTITYQV